MTRAGVCMTASISEVRVHLKFANLLQKQKFCLVHRSPSACSERERNVWPCKTTDYTGGEASCVPDVRSSKKVLTALMSKDGADLCCEGSPGLS